jgi:hypothetical protein
VSTRVRDHITPRVRPVRQESIVVSREKDKAVASVVNNVSAEGD